MLKNMQQGKWWYSPWAIAWKKWPTEWWNPYSLCVNFCCPRPKSTVSRSEEEKTGQIRMTSANTGCSVSVYTKQIWMEMEKKDKMMWIPVMTSLPPSPEAIHLFKYKCLIERCGTNHCQCRKAGLNFTQFFVAVVTQATRTRMMMLTRMKMIMVIWEMMKTMMV